MVFFRSCARSIVVPRVLAFVVFATAAAGVSAGRGEIKVGVFPAAPLVMDEGDEPEGLFIDLIEYFAVSRDWNVRYVKGTWSELLEALKEGTIDLLPAVGVTLERAKFYDFSAHPVFIDSGVLFTREKKTLNTIFELRGRRVAAVKGSIFTTGFSEYMASFGIEYELIFVEDNPSVMKAIEEGVADAGVCIYSLGTELAKRYDVKVTPINFSPIALSFAVPKGKNEQILKEIDELMAPMLDDIDSPYSRAIRTWTEGGRISIPKWIPGALLAAAAAGVILGLWAFALKREVNSKTRHLVEEIRERQDTETRLKRTLSERETLIRELYHRTKNSLQTVRSLLTLQSEENADSEPYMRLVADANSRIQAISIVHQLLYESSDLSWIPIGDYTRRLASEALRAFRGVGDGVAVEVVDDVAIVVPLDTGVPYGLILNELLNNSLRHAFPAGRKGRIEIRLSRGKSEHISMSYVDDGIGLPNGFDYEDQPTLGLKLVRSLAREQMKGALSFGARGGFGCVLEFPLKVYELRI